MLPAKSKEAPTVLNMARSVLEDALPSFGGGFDLEAFITPDGPVFSEVGARIGGGSIPKEVELSCGVNPVEEAILAQRGEFARHASPRQRGLVGQLNLSPVSGILAEAPGRFEHPDVVLSETPDRATRSPRSLTPTAEFARPVFRADSMESRRTTVSKLLHHMGATTRWEVSDRVASA